MDPNRRSQTVLRRALAGITVAVLALGSLTLAHGPQATADGAWQFTRIAESARLRAGLSAVHPGDVAVIRFSLGSFRGSDIFRPGAPVSVEIGCASRTTVRHGAVMDPTAHGALHYDADRDVYTYRWVTSASWEGTCRRLSLAFADGSVHDALVWFGEPFDVAAHASRPT